MKELIQDILIGGRPMTKLELANKEIERLNKIIEIKNNRIQQLMKRTRSAKLDRAIRHIEILQEIIYQQSSCDFWLLDRLDGIKNILKGSDTYD